MALVMQSSLIVWAPFLACVYNKKMHTREKYVRVIEFLFHCIKKWSSIFFLLREISRFSFSDGEMQPSPLVIELWKFSYTYLSFAFIWGFPCWLWLIAKKTFEIKHKFEIFLAKGELQSSLFWIQFQVIGICSCLFSVVVVFFAIIYSFPDSRRHYGVSTVPNCDRFHRTGWLPSSLYWASYNRTYYHLGGRGLVW